MTLESASRATYLAQLWAGSVLSTRLLPGRVRPIAASLKLTENCQARCVTCDYWKTRWQDHLDTDRAVALIDTLGQLGIRFLRFTGGEPLLRRDFFEILKRIDASKFGRISMQTNGLLLRKYHEEINQSPITRVSVSVDGMEESNDQIRGIKGYFKLAIDGMSLLRGKQLQLATSLNRRSAHELADLVDLASSIGAAFEFNLLDNRLYFFRDSNVSELWPRDEDIEPIENVLRHKLGRPEHEIDYVRRYFAGKGPDEPPCVLGFLELYIASNGDVMSGCYVLDPLGNVLKDDLETLLASPAYRERCVAMVNRQCPGCTCGVLSSLAVKHPLVALRSRTGKARALLFGRTG